MHIHTKGDAIVNRLLMSCFVATLLLPRALPAAAGSWTVAAVPTGNAWENLYDLSCVTSSDCWAVGEHVPVAPGYHQSLIRHWDGASWSQVAAPVADGTQGLQAVDCVSTSECWAVGYHDAQVLALRWDGNTWRVAVLPEAGFTAVLRGVDCLAADDCWAVGSVQKGDGERTLVQHWDGTEWDLTVSADRDPPLTSGLFAVACASADDCWAVGASAETSGNNPRSLIEHWDGTVWSIHPGSVSPDPYNVLFGVSCLSAMDCWAVGITGLEHWDGSAWSHQDPIDADGRMNQISDVTCLTAQDCRAVGVAIGPDYVHVLTADWDGSAWTIGEPPAGGENGGLYAVTCLSSVDCQAVGGSIGDQITALTGRYGETDEVVVEPKSGGGAIDGLALLLLLAGVWTRLWVAYSMCRASASASAGTSPSTSCSAVLRKPW